MLGPGDEFLVPRLLPSRSEIRPRTTAFSAGDNSVLTQTGLGADLAGVARSLGWPAPQVRTITESPELQEHLHRTVAEDGPWLTLVTVDPASYQTSANRSKPGVDVVESAVLLRRHLQERKDPS
jgi:hypothetical protein